MTQLASRTTIASQGLGMTAIRPGLRQTRPVYFNAYNNGLGVVPRRGWDPFTVSLIQGASDRPVAGIAAWARTAPQRLLQMLFDVHPMMSQARSNVVSLGFSPGDTHIVAVKKTPAGDEQIDPEGTAELDSFWDRLDPEVGGLTGLQVALYDMAATTGLCTVEGVPGPRGTGLQDIITFDSLSVRFRDTWNARLPFGGRLLEQNQGGQWATLDRTRCLAVPVFGTRDQPYGRPLYPAVLVEALRDLRTQQTLDDFLHSVAWPRLAVGFPFEEAVKFATENPEVLAGQASDGGDLTAVMWATQQFDALKDLMNALLASDQFIMPKGSEPRVLSGAEGLRSLEGTLTMQRHRLVMALDQLPGLLGITDGGTQAYTVAQYKLAMKKLEWIRAFVNSVLVLLANLHLRLLGSSLTARADTEPMSPLDALADQQARQIEIANEYALVDRGAQSEEDAAINLTGSGPVKRQARLNQANGKTASGGQPGQATKPLLPGDSTPKPNPATGDNQTEP